MAINANTNPIVCTSTGTISTQHLKICGIRWVGMTTAHVAELTDNSGHSLWKSVANGTGDVESIIEMRFEDGVILSTLGSGTLYLYSA